MCWGPFLVWGHPYAFLSAFSSAFRIGSFPVASEVASGEMERQLRGEVHSLSFRCILIQLQSHN